MFRHSRAGRDSEPRPLRVLFRRPLLVGIAGLVTVTLVTLTATLLVLTSVGSQIDRANQTISALRDTHAAMLNKETGLRGFLITRDEAFLEPYEAGVTALADADARLLALTRDDAEMAAAIARLRAAEEDFLVEWAAPVLRSQPATDDQAGLSALLQNGKVRFDRYRVIEEEVRATVQARRLSLYAQQDMLLVSGVVVGLVVALVVAVAFRRSHLRLVQQVVPPTQDLRDTLAALADGDVDARALASGPKELHDIADDVNSLGVALRERGELVAARERDLVAARDEAERAGQAKTAFLATMSHEIRTPLNAVIGLTDLLMRTGMTEDQRSHLETISSSGDSLLTLINDILDFSKIEAGELDLEQAPFDLADVVYDVAQLLAPQAAGKGLDLLVDIPGDTGWRVVGDGGRIRQVVMNLVGNAVKFTAEGQVVVVLTRDGDLGEDGTMLCRLSVIDTGIGIAPEQQHRLFRSFSQGDASITRSYGGTGLGLAISQRIAEAMGGDITVYSDLGAGSTFTVSVRLAPAAVAPQRGAGTELAGRRLLVVDDNLTNLRILEHQLETFGATAVLVDSGAAALARIEAGESFDACLLDLHMPGMTGGELAARLRAHPAAAATPLVLLSSSTALHAPGAASFAARMHKPVRPERLLQTLLSVFRPDVAGAHAPAHEPDGRPLGRRLRVLVAEDHEVNAHLIGLYLRQLGHDFVRVSDGRAAVAAVQRDSYDVVLMDAQMPVMGGVDATRAIRRLPVRQPRIIAVTASVLASDRTAFLGAGAEDFLTKPVRLATLDERLRRWAPDGRAPAPGGAPSLLPGVPVPRQGGSAHAAPDVAPGGAALEDLALDGETVEELRDLGEEAFAHLLGQYASGLPDTVAALLAAADDGAWSEDDERSVPRLAHRLKGSSAAMGAARLAELCQVLQHGTGPAPQQDQALAALPGEAVRVQAAVAELLSPGR